MVYVEVKGKKIFFYLYLDWYKTMFRQCNITNTCLKAKEQTYSWLHTVVIRNNCIFYSSSCMEGGLVRKLKIKYIFGGEVNGEKKRISVFHFLFLVIRINCCLFITRAPIPSLPLVLSWRRQCDLYMRHVAWPPAAQWSLRWWENRRNRTVVFSKHVVQVSFEHDGL